MNHGKTCFETSKSMKVTNFTIMVIIIKYKNEYLYSISRKNVDLTEHFSRQSDGCFSIYVLIS